MAITFDAILGKLRKKDSGSSTPGPQGEPGKDGVDGQGIDHVEFTSTTNPAGVPSEQGFTDTYTVYGDLAETIILGTFQVTNGEKGDQGVQGIQGIQGLQGLKGDPGDSVDVRRATLKSYYFVRSTNGTRASSGITTTGFGTAANSTDDNTNLTRYTTGNTSGSFAGIETTSFIEHPIASNADFECVIKTGSDITNQRIWVGLISSTLQNTDNQPGVNIAFRYSTVAGDTSWKGVVDNNTTQQLTAAIGTIAANTIYKFKIRCDYAANKYYFSVNGSVEVEITSVIPIGTRLGFCVEMTNTATGARTLHFSRMDLLHN